MTLNDYYRLAGEFDRLFLRPNAPIAWFAIHNQSLISNHPAQIEPYLSLFQNQDSPSIVRFIQRFVRRTIRLLIGIPWFPSESQRQLKRQMTRIPGVKLDLFLFSWLVNEEHLSRKDDFYLSILPLLEDRKTFLLLGDAKGYVNQSDCAIAAFRNLPNGRVYWPEPRVAPLRLRFFWDVMYGALMLMLERIRTRNPFRISVLYFLLGEILSSKVLFELNLYYLTRSLARKFQPTVAMALYEGYAWERCFWAAMRDASPRTVRIGYQHAPIREHSYSLLRNPTADGRYNPDSIGTVGRYYRDLLREAINDGVDIFTLGYHRLLTPESGTRPKGNKSVLFVPEGIHSETSMMVKMAEACARADSARHYIVRLHPILKMAEIESLVGAEIYDNFKTLPNLSFSENTAIEHDFARCEYLVYRSTSVAIQAVLFGLKLIYLRKSGDEMDVDPLYELKAWRESIISVNDLQDLVTRHSRKSYPDIEQDWRRALDFCRQIFEPFNPEKIASILERAGGEALAIGGNSHA